jgi:hypothetical protein
MSPEFSRSHMELMPCRVAALRRAGGGGFLHDTRYPFHDFWNLSVFMDCHRAVGLYIES